MRLRVAFGIGLIVLASLATPAHYASAQITRPYAPEGEQQVGPGVEHEWGSLDVAKGGRQNINIVEVDPSDSRTQLRVSQADGIASHRRTVVEQNEGYSQDGRRVVASVNGSLFSFLTGDIGGALGGAGLGMNVSDGELINAGDPAQRGTPVPAFGVSSGGAALIGEPQVTRTLTLPGGPTVVVDRINQERFDGDVVLYTPRWDTHTRTDALGSEYVIDGFDLPIGTTGTYSGTVAEVRDGAGDSAIGPEQVVLSISNTAPPLPVTLTAGSEVVLDIAISAAWASATQVVSGRNMLVVGGASVVSQPDSDGRHARTAAGITAAGRVLILTADSGSYLYGMTLTDVAQLMLSLGAVDAVNLDGGTSSQMAVRLPGDIGTSTVNTIQKPIDRPVVNALQVVSAAPDGPLSRLVLTPPQATVAAGQTFEFVAKGQDDDLNGVVVDPETLEWTVERVGGGTGPVVGETERGIAVMATELGDYMVTVSKDSFEATALLTVGHDTSAPVASGLNAAIAAVASVGKNDAAVMFGWTVVDNVAVQSIQVQRKIGSGAWTSVATAPSAIAASVTVGFGLKLVFRIRATDISGNTSAWLLSKAYRLTLYDDASQHIGLTGSWQRKRAAGAIGSKFVRSQAHGATSALTFEGLQVALIGNRGPTHGVADVSLDGGPPSPITADATSLSFRRILFISPAGTSSDETTIDVRNVGTASNLRFDVDAFLVLAPVD